MTEVAMENPTVDKEKLGDAISWQLWRQDDHGNKVIIGEYASQQEAERLKQEFEDRGHRQIYWVEKINHEVHEAHGEKNI
jgi:hypothetical protein